MFTVKNIIKNLKFKVKIMYKIHTTTKHINMKTTIIKNPSIKRNNIKVVDNNIEQLDKSLLTTSEEIIIAKTNCCITCGKNALYNIPSETRGIYCSAKYSE